MSAPPQSAYPPPPGYGAPPPADLGVIRSVGRCILLLIVSFGLWGIAWMYHTTKEVSSRVNHPPPSPGLRAFLSIVPIANLVVLFMAWQDIDNYCKRVRSQDFNVILFFLLSIFIPFAAFVTYPMVQSRMNDAHRAATNGAARDARMQAIDWICVGIGIAGFVLFWLFLIVVIIAAGTSSHTTT